MIRLAGFLLLLSAFAVANETIVRPGDSLARVLADARPGDRIRVMRGTYTVDHVVIDKSISVIGEDWPVIDGGGKGEVFTITADHVELTGLEIINSGHSYIKENAGVRLKDVRGCTVRGNRFRNNFFAIYVSNSKSAVIHDNKIFVTTPRNVSRSGNAIHVWKSDSIDITGNEITGHRDGIYFEFVRNATIVNNRCENNSRYGLHFMFSDHCRYVGNVFRGNSSGVAVMYSKYVEMKNNAFENNWGPASYGLMLKDINDSHVSGNTIKNNTTGIFAEGCSRSSLSDNDFESNGWALKIMANCADNRIVSNNFVGNTFDVSTNSTYSYNRYEGNYWSNYTGYDLNRDGFGDVPYRPVRLFSWIAEQQPAAMFLLRSFFVTVLDLAESMIPVLTPAKLIDDKPSMRMIRR